MVMAEIHVQSKKHQAKNNTWLWIVLLLIAAAVIYFFATRNKNVGDENTVNQNNTTSFQPVKGISNAGSRIWTAA